MKPHPVFAKPLLTPAGDESQSEFQDRVRRIVSPSEIIFRSGTMFLTGKGTMQLAQAILDGRIQGDTDQARVIIDQIGNGLLPRRAYMSDATARTICQDIIEGRAKGNVEMARKYLDLLDQNSEPSS